MDLTELSSTEEEATLCRFFSFLPLKMYFNDKIRPEDHKYKCELNSANCGAHLNTKQATKQNVDGFTDTPR